MATTSAANVQAKFETIAQQLVLNATVTSTAGVVNQGTVTFTVLNNTTAVGTAVVYNVTAGAAGGNYTLPASTAANGYIIKAVYSGGTNFSGSTDTSHALTVSPAATTTTGSSAAAVFKASAAQTIALTAGVTSPGGTVSQGTATFTLLSGSTVIGAPVTASVTASAASASYSLPAGTAAGTYIVQVVYNGTANFLTSTDSSHSLTVSQAIATTAAANAKATFSTAADSVILTATVSSSAGTVKEGTETFTIENGTTPVGSPVNVNVVNGAASASYNLPAGTPAATYTIVASYNGTVDYSSFIDSSHTLTISAPAVSSPALSAAPATGTTITAAPFLEGFQTSSAESAGNGAHAHSAAQIAPFDGQAQQGPARAQ